VTGDIIGTADAPAYGIANFQINDADRYHQFEKGFLPILKSHGAEIFSYDNNTLKFEGASICSGRMAMFKTPSVEAAQAWYNYPAYLAL